jgi:hypothetical protein
MLIDRNKIALAAGLKCHSHLVRQKEYQTLSRKLAERKIIFAKL